METQGQRVRKKREARGWSQDDLAREVSVVVGKKVKQQNIQQVESDQVKMPAYYFELCQVLETTPKELRLGIADDSPENVGNVSATDQIDAFLSDASPRSREILEKMKGRVARGELTEEDIVLLEMIADRLRK